MANARADTLPDELAQRTIRQVIDDHIRCRLQATIEAELARNYAEDVVILTSRRAHRGHDAVRRFNAILRKYVPDEYQIITEEADGRFGFIAWRAREPGKSVGDGADSFVVEDGKIVFQSIHYSLQIVMPD